MTPAKATAVVTRDAITESVGNLVALTFPKVNSPNFGIVVDLCKSAERYDERSFSGDVQHICLFSKSPRQAQLAYMALQYSFEWKGLKAYCNGRLERSAWEVMKTIECYLDSTKCNDPSAHCCETIVNPSNLKLRSVFPCRRLLQANFRFDLNHPASLQDQIQAFAVRTGFSICPRFDAGKFRNEA